MHRSLSFFAASGVLATAAALPVLAATQTGPFAVSVTTSPNPYAIEGTTSVTKSVGVLGYGTGTTDVALEGYATKAGSTGLEGFSQATSGTIGDGVFGYSGNGAGVFGDAAAGVGVYGSSSASDGTGIQGSGSGTGVYGLSSAGTGVYGQTNVASSSSQLFATPGVVGFDNSSGTAGEVGVEGVSTYGTGVLGATSGKGSADYGVYGDETSTSAAATGVTLAGVYGNSANNSGVLANSTNGDAIDASGGFNGIVATSTGFVGVSGALADDGCGGCAGVSGEDSSGAGSDNYGVQGISDYGTALYGTVDTSAGTGLDVETSNGATPIEVNSNVDENNFDDQTNLLQLNPTGNLSINGSLTQAGNARQALRDARGVKRVTYASSATQSTLEDFGRGQMSAGSAHVSLDPAFASMLAAADYLVFVTPRGPNTGIYVTGQSLSGFDIRDSNGRSSFAFDYRIVGRPRTEHAEPRLAELVPERTVADVSRAERIARLRASGHWMARARLAKTLHPRIVAAARKPVRIALRPKAAKAIPMPFVYRPPAVR